MATNGSRSAVRGHHVYKEVWRSEWKLAVERVKDGKWCSVRSSAMSNIYAPITAMPHPPRLVVSGGFDLSSMPFGRDICLIWRIVTVHSHICVALI